MTQDIGEIIAAEIQRDRLDETLAECRSSWEDAIDVLRAEYGRMVKNGDTDFVDGFASAIALLEGCPH